MATPASLHLENLAVNVVPVGTWLVPNEKARALSIILSFPNVLASDYEIDLVEQFELGKFTTFQTLFVDNSLNPATFTAKIDQTQQTINVAPYSQGYFAVQAPMPCRVKFATLGVAVVTVLLINVPVPSAIWGDQLTAGLGSADKIRPIYSVFQNTSGSQALNAAGGTVSFLGPLSPNAFIKTVSLSLAGLSTAGAPLVCSINDTNGPVLWNGFIPLGTATQVVTNINEVIVDYLSTNGPGMQLNFVYAAAAGLQGGVALNTAFLTTSEVGP